MSAIVELLDRIQGTNALIAEYEKAASRPGAPKSVSAQIRGLEKLKESLEQEFSKYARDDELEVCRYRLIPESTQRPVIDAISNAWREYQSMFSAVYAAVTKSTPGKPRQIAQETQFIFAFAFSGSIGVTLALPTKQITNFVARDLERANQTIFEMSKARTSEQLGLFTERIGRKPVLSFGRWVEAHVKFTAGAGIDWTGPTERSIPPLLVQIQEFKILQHAFHEMTEPKEEERLVSGRLTGAWMRNSKFLMESDDGEQIEGKFVDAITPERAATLPRRYVAKIRTTTVIKLATETEEVSHFLVELVRDLST